MGSCRFFESLINFIPTFGVNYPPLYSGGQTPESHSNSNRFSLGQYLLLTGPGINTISWVFSIFLTHTPTSISLNCIDNSLLGSSTYPVFSVIIQGAGKWSSPLVEYKTVYQVSLVNPTLWDTLSGSVTNHLHIRVDVFVGHLPENYLNPLKPETYCIAVYYTSQPAHESKIRYFDSATSVSCYQ